MIVAAVLVVATLVALVAFLLTDAGRERRKGVLVTASVALAIAVLGVVPLMGIPGAIVYELSAPWVRAMIGEGYAELGDGAWPAAILITLAWPASIVLAYVVAFGPLRRRPGWMRWMALILIPCAMGVMLALGMHWPAG